MDPSEATRSVLCTRFSASMNVSLYRNFFPTQGSADSDCRRQALQGNNLPRPHDDFAVDVVLNEWRPHNRASYSGSTSARYPALDYRCSNRSTYRRRLRHATGRSTLSHIGAKNAVVVPGPG